MASEGRRDAATLRELVQEHVERFEFLQAVRLFERIAPDAAPVGSDNDPSDEVVRFRSDLSAIFPRGDLRAFEPAVGDAPPHVTVNFMGVATPGSFGSLPSRYAEEIRALVRDKNTALRDFLDLFNHRLVSLFFRARARHYPALVVERGSDNPLERALSALIGLSTPGLGGRLSVPDRSLLAHGGLLARRPVPAIALEALLSSVFDLTVQVEQFRPGRYEVAEADQTRLGLANVRLGEDVMLGREITLVDAAVRLRTEPLDWERFEGLLPDAIEHRRFVELARFATGEGLDFDVQLVLRAEDVPALRMGEDGTAIGRLGWSSWLPCESRAEPADDAVFPSRPFLPLPEYRAEVAP
jgi:type VI secretion system protein ImpH